MSDQEDIEYGWEEEDQEQEDFQDHEFDEEEALEEDPDISTLTQEEALFKNFTDVLQDNPGYMGFITGKIIPIQILRGLNPVALANAYVKYFGGTHDRGCGCGKMDKQEQGHEQGEAETQDPCIAYSTIIEVFYSNRTVESP